MNVVVSNSRAELGRAAAARAAELIKLALASRTDGQPIVVVFAVAPSQDDFWRFLLQDKSIPWHEVIIAHMDNYPGDFNAAASFGRILRDDFVAKLHELPTDVWYLDISDGNIDAACDRINNLFGDRRPDVVLMGIGENAHIAFNDPPADFQTEKMFHKVTLDEACRQQQVADGCYPNLEAVPAEALSMTVYGLTSAKTGIVCCVPGPRKAAAVRQTLSYKGRAPQPCCPASALMSLKNATLYLDPDSAAEAQAAGLL